jgi:6-phosphogluconolactonase (cycloisomerase 2 family)
MSTTITDTKPCRGNDGKYLAVNSVGNDTCSVFEVDAVTGALTLRQNVPTGTLPEGISYQKNDAHAIITNALDNTMTIYNVDPTLGVFYAPQVFSTGMGPFFVDFSNSHRYIAVSNFLDNTIGVYKY